MRSLREYYRPSSAQEAVEIKSHYGARAAFLAGGSDLMVHKPRRVEAVIDIRHAGLDEVNEEESSFFIGGAALLRDVEASMATFAGGLMRTAVRETAPWLIRNAATLAGNVANASPAADSVPALLALDALLILRDGGRTETSIPAIVVGPHQTSLGDRLIEKIRVPRKPTDWRGVFTKLARSKSDIAQVNVAVGLAVRDGVVCDLRIALGAVAPVPMRARRSEAILEGRPPTPELLSEVELAVREEVRPISDWRASEWYRRRMSGVLVRRALERLIGLEGK
jgi:carbon-monoxide dehydrogenase medium subunit